MIELFKKLKLPVVTNIEKVNSSQNSVFKVTTIDNIYLVKEYSLDAIKTEKDLELRTKQINISKILNNSGIPTIIPIEFDNKYFIMHNNRYYLIYNYLEYKTLTQDELSIFHIKTLATTLAKLHKTNLQYELPIQYRQINIDYDNYLQIFKNKKETEELYNLMKTNKDKLKKLIKDCNDSLKKVQEDLCVSHNDYKLKNILWHDEKIYLIDFDASSLSNPVVSTLESAFALSIQNKKLNEQYYKIYLKSYIENYGSLKTNFNDALNCAMNGKLQWYEYLLSNYDDEIRIKDSISMTNELLEFMNTKDKQMQIYNDIEYRI